MDQLISAKKTSAEKKRREVAKRERDVHTKEDNLFLELVFSNNS